MALPLVGTTWTLTTIASGDAVSSVLNGTEVTAEFTADDTVSGSAGCNRYSGSYTWTGDQLSFSALASTKMACADDVMAQERRSSPRWDRSRRSRSRVAADALRRFRARCCWGSDGTAA